MGPLWCTHQTASPVHSLRCSVSAGIDHEWRPDYFYRKGFQLFLHLGKLSAPHRHVGDLLISNMATSLIVRLLGASYQSSLIGNMIYVILVFPGHQGKHLQWKFTGKELHFCKRRNVQSLPPTYSGLVPFLERCLPVMMKSLQITNDWTKWGYRRCGRCFSKPGEIPSHAWWLGKIINLCVFIFNHPI